jgi:hypothetical protein
MINWRGVRQILQAVYWTSLRTLPASGLLLLGATALPAFVLWASDGWWFGTGVLALLYTVLFGWGFVVLISHSLVSTSILRGLAPEIRKDIITSCLVGHVDSRHVERPQARDRVDAGSTQGWV